MSASPAIAKRALAPSEPEEVSEAVQNGMAATRSRNPANECGACGLDLGSLTSFDAHRVGVHAYTFREGLGMEPPREDGRRCLELDEMLAGSYRGRRFVQNARGRWTLASRVEEAKRRFPQADRGQKGELVA